MEKFIFICAVYSLEVRARNIISTEKFPNWDLFIFFFVFLGAGCNRIYKADFSGRVLGMEKFIFTCAMYSLQR